MVLISVCLKRMPIIRSNDIDVHVDEGKSLRTHQRTFRCQRSHRHLLRTASKLLREDVACNQVGAKMPTRVGQVLSACLVQLVILLIK